MAIEENLVRIVAFIHSALRGFVEARSQNFSLFTWTAFINGKAISNARNKKITWFAVAAKIIRDVQLIF
jgi:hypothetical protein